MKTEISAGGIIVRFVRKTWQVLLMKDMSGAWTFPKGIIEKGEKAEDAARREISEEVGITGLTFIAPVGSVGYFYRKNGLINKTVHYFVFQTSGIVKLTLQKEEGIQDAQFFPLPEAMDIIGYEKTNIPLLVKTERVLKTL